MKRTALILALAVAPATLAPLAADAQAPFNARPTTAYECGSLIADRGADRVWTGWFSGRKESPHGVDGGIFGRYEDTRRRACFVDERDCRNWLYNMQSEYTAMVWRAECRRGTG